ncbi:MAG: peroxiredoxin family protein [Bacteroidetes bacterium]|nr:peroxiredoxin family protein [Bacteroidota bacterium]
MVGDIAKNFSLKDQHGDEFELYKYLDKRILLVFYPRDDSPVCTLQLSNYEKYLNEFEKNNINVVGINTAAKDSHFSFCNKLKLNFPVLSDISKQISKNYKALNLLGINKRKLVLIDTNKRIIFEKTILPFYYLKAGQIISEVN